jgi:thiamine biosynthesis lipoprotein
MYSEPAPPRALQRYSMHGATMGGRYTAVFYAPSGADQRAIGASLLSAVQGVDGQMSTWKDDSDLCRLNAAPAHIWIAVPAPLAHVLDAGVTIGRQSRGAFDMGVGALVEAWGFGPSPRAPALPRAAAPGTLPALAYLSANTGIDVDLNRCQIRKRGPVALDLSGIAKGYGVDQLAACLDGWAIDRYLVGIDGEMRCRGAKPDGQAWAVAVERPVYGVREASGVMALRDVAIATSGDYRRWVDVGGIRHAHTMDPGWQRPVQNCLASVTVLAATCMEADAWATALMVLGEEHGIAMARERGMDVLFMLRKGELLEEVSIRAGQVCEEK